MTQGLKKRIKRFAQHVKEHACRVKSGDESWSEALESTWDDTKRILLSNKGRVSLQSRKEAIQLLRLGRDFYNFKNYAQAEVCFRQAITTDPDCAMGYTYLGYAIYRQGRRPEAVSYWQRAIQAAPESDAAKKARRKILHVARQKEGEANMFDESTGFD